MIRQRKTTDPLQIVRKLDAFPKIPTEYKKTSTIGGTCKHFKYIFYFIVLNVSKHHIDILVSFIYVQFRPVVLCSVFYFSITDYFRILDWIS